MIKPADWIKSIKVSEDVRDMYGDAKSWKTYFDYFCNNMNTSNILTYNILYAMGKVLTVKSYFTNPSVTVRPALQHTASPEAFIFARIIEAIDNWLLSDVMKVKKQIKRICLDAYLYGTGIGKLGYDSEYGYTSDTADSNIQDATLTQFNKGTGDKIEYNTTIIPGMPWMKRVNPKDILFAWDATDIDDCSWIANRIVRHIDDVKADVKLTNTEALKPNVKFDNDKEVNIKTLKDYIEMWEIRDCKTGRMYILTEGSDKFLYNEVDVLQNKGLPYEVVTFNDIGDSIWGVPDCKILMPQQNEINEARTQAMLHRRLAIVKILAEAGSISPEQKLELLSDKPMAIVDVIGNPNSCIREFSVNIPGDLVNWVESIRQDTREIIGLSRVQLGELEAGGRKTAYEVGQVAAASELRISERADAVSDFLKGVINKVNDIIFRLWQTDRTIGIIGNDNIKYWLNYKGTELQGDYVIDVNVEEKRPDTVALRKQEAMELYTVMMKDPELSPETRQRLRSNLILQYGSIPKDILDATTAQGESPISLNQFIKTQMPMQQEQMQRGAV